MKNKIWITRKTRIFAERRMQRLDLISKVILIYYSFILVCLSIINFKNASAAIEEIIIISSFAILITSIFLSSQRFKERAIYFKNCYIQLDELYLKICHAEENNPLKAEELEQFRSEYLKILDSVENHSSYDFICLRYSLRKNKKTTLEPFKISDYVSFWSFKALRLVILCVLFVLPPILIFVFMFK